MIATEQKPKPVPKRDHLEVLTSYLRKFRRKIRRKGVVKKVFLPIAGNKKLEGYGALSWPYPKGINRIAFAIFHQSVTDEIILGIYLPTGKLAFQATLNKKHPLFLESKDVLEKCRKNID